MRSKSQDEVVRALGHPEKRCGKELPAYFQSIIVDNGCKFLSSSRPERSALAEETKRTTIYYAHPYSAWKRRSNGNRNKLIRRFVPKGTDIRKLEPVDVERIQYRMNHYLRKMPGYYTPAELCTSGALDFVGQVRQ